MREVVWNTGVAVKKPTPSHVPTTEHLLIYENVDSSKRTDASNSRFGIYSCDQFLGINQKI
jgi:hypothetical protein